MRIDKLDRILLNQKILMRELLWNDTQIRQDIVNAIDKTDLLLYPQMKFAKEVENE